MTDNDRRDDMPLIVALAAGRSIRDAAKNSSNNYAVFLGRGRIV